MKTTGCKTGRTGEFGVKEFIFSHLTISSKVFDENKNRLCFLAEDYGCDFVSVEKTGTIEFYHITDSALMDEISLNGLMPGNTIGDLGSGVYVIESGSEDAALNLYDYLFEMHNGDMELDVLVVNGTYTGPYTECVYGEGHEGYIVIPNKVGPKDIIDMFTETLEYLEEVI